MREAGTGDGFRHWRVVKMEKVVSPVGVVVLRFSPTKSALVSTVVANSLQILLPTAST